MYKKIFYGNADSAKRSMHMLEPDWNNFARGCSETSPSSTPDGRVIVDFLPETATPISVWRSLEGTLGETHHSLAPLPTELKTRRTRRPGNRLLI